jgi:protein-S-isoprenylcysteine O-methyltransferase Ste14
VVGDQTSHTPVTGPSRIAVRVTAGAAHLIGGLSLLAFGAFLFGAPVSLLDLGLPHGGVLLLDLGLCLGFFLQHSGMIRRSFRSRLSRRVPSECTAAIYAIASGLALSVLMILWQPTEVTLYSIHGPVRWVLRGVFVASILGFVWGIRALRSLDAFGVEPLENLLHGRPLRETPLTIRGPYQWVRHPLYLFVLAMLWSNPDVPTDRLVLNASFTAWIVIGSILEERDLVADFGDDYRRYQTQVPMLMPTRWPKPR